MSQEVAIRDYKALTVSPERLHQVIQNNIGGRSLRLFDLQRVKVPSGGMTVWELPGVDGPTVSQSFECIMVAVHDVRHYWASKNSNGVPPDCTSHDLVTGVGNPGGSCQACPNAQFGSALNMDGSHGKGQACKQVKQILLITKGDILPTLLTVPPTSLREVNNYILRLTSKGLMYQEVITRLSLKKTKSSGNVDYAEMECTFVAELNEQERANIVAISHALRDSMEWSTDEHA